MASQLGELGSARKLYVERLDILRQSRAMYDKNKHRSLNRRGPYEYGLKVAQEEFDTARAALKIVLKSSRESEPLVELPLIKPLKSANDSPIKNAKAARQPIVAPQVLQSHPRPKRVFLAKLQQAEALKRELAMVD